MTCPPNPSRNRRWQFSLGALFAAVTYVAFACAATKYFVLAIGELRPSADPIGPLLALFAIPICLCGGIGVLRGRVRFWLEYGACIDVAVLGLILLSMLGR